MPLLQKVDAASCRIAAATGFQLHPGDRKRSALQYRAVNRQSTFAATPQKRQDAASTKSRCGILPHRRGYWLSTSSRRPKTFGSPIQGRESTIDVCCHTAKAARCRFYKKSMRHLAASPRLLAFNFIPATENVRLSNTGP